MSLAFFANWNVVNFEPCVLEVVHVCTEFCALSHHQSHGTFLKATVLLKVYWIFKNISTSLQIPSINLILKAIREKYMPKIECMFVSVFLFFIACPSWPMGSQA